MDTIITRYLLACFVQLIDEYAPLMWQLMKWRAFCAITKLYNSCMDIVSPISSRLAIYILPYPNRYCIFPSSFFPHIDPPTKLGSPTNGYIAAPSPCCTAGSPLPEKNCRDSAGPKCAVCA